MPEIEQVLFGAAIAALLAASLLSALALAYRKAHLDRMAFIVLAVGFLAQSACIVIRWVDAGRVPLSNLFETLVFFSWCTVLVYIVADRRYHIRVAGVILLPAAFFMMAVAALLYEAPVPLQEELRSRWLALHAGISLLGYAGFALAFATGFFYVIQEDLVRKRYVQVRYLIQGLVVALGTGLGLYVGYLIADPTLFEDATGHRVYGYSRSDWTIIAVSTLVGLAASVLIGWIAARGASRPSFANRLPALHVLDRLSFHSVVFGFILLAFGIVSGAIWAQVAWGEWWSWDPKETWALLAWIFYAGYLGMRELLNWRGRHSAVLAIVGMFFVLFAFLGINLFVPGRHDFN